MKYPDFFDEVRTIKMVDPLSDVLGSFENGEIDFTYTDVVKSAGHSCPTVGGAYLMTLKALEALFPEGRAVRGGVKVAFSSPMEEGVAGVIGNVISHITGATDKSGFKGLGGRYARHSLMVFESDIGSSARFTRVDNNACVDVFYNPNIVGGNPKQQILIQRILQGIASSEEKREFGEMWQDRVKRIIVDNADNENVISVRPCS